MADAAASDVTIGDLKLNGAKISARIADAVTVTSLTQTITGASQLQLTVHDPDRTILTSGLCQQRSTVAVDDLTFSLTQVTKTGNLITLTFEDYAVAVLRRKRSKVKAAPGTLSRVEFCRKVIAKDAPWIVVDGPSSGPLILEEIAIGTISNFVDVTAGDVTTASTGGKRIVPAKLVAQYAKDAGFTGSDLVIAVAIAHAESGFDANNVGRNSDQWQSRDRGLWQINDHYHPQFSDAQCFDPAECARIAFELSSGGHDFNPWTTYRNNAYRQFLGDAQAAVDATKPTKMSASDGTSGSSTSEDHWAGITRIMGEIGWRVFARRGHIMIAPDSWLLEQPGITVREHTGGVDGIDFDADPRKKASTVTVTAQASRWTVLPGEPVTVAGLGPGDDTYLVAQISRSLAQTTAQISLTKKQKTLPEPAANADAGTEGTAAPATPTTIGDCSPQVKTMVDFALAQRGDTYVMGGNGPSEWDCSGLVLAATKAGHASIGARVANDQYAACVNAGTTISVTSAINTCGALLFEPGSDPGGTYGIGHVAISLGNGQTMEARGTAYGVNVFSATEGRTWTYAGLVPGMDYQVPGS